MGGAPSKNKNEKFETKNLELFEINQNGFVLTNTDIIILILIILAVYYWPTAKMQTKT